MRIRLLPNTLSSPELLEERGANIFKDLTQHSPRKKNGEGATKDIHHGDIENTEKDGALKHYLILLTNLNHCNV